VCHRWPQHRHGAEGRKSLERAGVTKFGVWRRRVEALLIGRMSDEDLSVALEWFGLKYDYDVGLTAERAAEMRVERLWRPPGDEGSRGGHGGW
jgi:hypothetical protein